jgi:hypothetical protein
MKKPAAAEWSIDLTSICGDGNGQNALKVQIRELVVRLFEQIDLLAAVLSGFLVLHQIHLW